MISIHYTKNNEYYSTCCTKQMLFFIQDFEGLTMQQFDDAYFL